MINSKKTENGESRLDKDKSTAPFTSHNQENTSRHHTLSTGYSSSNAFLIMRSPFTFLYLGSRPILSLAFHVLILFTVLFLLSHDKSPKSEVTHSNDNILVSRGFAGSLDNAVASNATSGIHIAEDYTCTPTRPCSNGACCGASGNCGFGEQYIQSASFFIATFN